MEREWRAAAERVSLATLVQLQMLLQRCGALSQQALGGLERGAGSTPCARRMRLQHANDNGC